MRRLAATLIAFVVFGGTTSASAQSVYPAEVLRDLPTGANVFAILETVQPEVVADRFNSGGLNGGEPGRASAFLASWSQTQYRIGDVSISSPIDGTPLLFPEVTWWNQIGVTTGVMPADATAAGLAVSLAPRRAAAKWTATFEGSGSGGGLAQEASSTKPPAIVRLSDWAHGSAVASGPAMNSRLGLVAGAAWTRAATLERDAPASIQADTRSAFAHAAFALTPERELRALAWVQDDSLHLQATFRRGRSLDPPEDGWRVFGGYTRRSRTRDAPAIGPTEVDRLIDGPIPSLVPEGDGREGRWTIGARATPAWRTGRHALMFGGDLERTSASASSPFSGVLLERVNGVAARAWHYTGAGIESHRHATLVAAFAEDRLSLSPRVRIDAALRFESADARARGAAEDIAWRTWLPRARLHWDIGTPLHIRFVTGVARSANQPMLGLLAHGDPAAPTARVLRWDGPLIARVGPGTGGDAAFSAIDPDLKRPITDEFAIGFESNPRPSMRFSMMGFARRERSLINVVNIGVPASRYTTLTIPDANADLVGPADDQQLVVYNRTPESFGQDRYLLTNPGQEAATMGAFVVSARVTSDRLFLQVGGTASASVGSGGNRGFRAFENDPDINGELFVNPNAATSARGRLFNDRAYTIKWTTVYVLPAGIRMGAIVRYQDGQPFSRMVVVPDLNQGAEAIQAFANGRSRFTYTGTVDLRLQKGIAAGRMRLDLILDAYNLLNMANEVEEDVVTGPHFRAITAVQPPRSFHIGLRARHR